MSTTSRYFVRHINDTPSDPTTPAVPAVNNEVRQYFNADNRTVHSAPLANEIPSADSKVFTSDGLTFKRIDGGNTVEVTGLASASSAFALVIPPTSSFFNLPVVRIANDAFKNASRLRTITIPASVEEIGDRAFAGSTLENIRLLASVGSIGEGAFAGCTNLATADLSCSTIETLEAKMFFNCPSLKNVALPSTLTHIKESAFENCFSLVSISLPDSVLSLGTRVFYNCKAMYSFRSGSSLMEIEKDCFANCVSLSEIIEPSEFIQDNVHILKDTALYKNADYDNYGIKCVLGTVLDTAEPKSKYFKPQLPSDAHAIGSYAFMKWTGNTIHLPRAIKVLMPNALAQHSKRKVVENGFVKTVDSLAIKAQVTYGGTVMEWRNITKLHDEKQLYPVCVTCTGDENEGKSTFIDYI